MLILDILGTILLIICIYYLYRILSKEYLKYDMQKDVMRAENYTAHKKYKKKLEVKKNEMSKMSKR